MQLSSNFIKNLINSISSDYILDLYEPKYITPKGMKSPKNYIDETIDLYCKNHETIKDSFLKNLRNTFENIVSNDTILNLDNKIILKELYKIIFLIDYTNQILDFILDKSYPKKYFAYYQSDKRELNRISRSHKRMIVNAKTPITFKGEHRLNWWFNKIFAMNNKIIKFYLHSFTLIDFEKCKFIQKEDEELQLLLFNFLESKLIQKTTDKDILKSLAILLHSELRYFLKLKDFEAKIFTTEILQILFNYKPNDEEFNSTIYFRSSIMFMPIFGAKRTSHYNKNEKNFIRTKILNELSMKEKKDFSGKDFDLIFESHMKKPHMQFLQKYPVEFFRKNPKYSTI